MYKTIIFCTITLLLSLFGKHSSASRITLDNRTDAPAELALDILWARDKTIIAPARGKQEENWWGLRCINGFTIKGLDGIVAGITLTIPNGPCGSFTIVIGQEVIDKNRIQRELGELQVRFKQLQGQTVLSGQSLSLEQLERQKTLLEEYQTTKQELAARQALLAEFDKKVNDLKELLTILQQKKDKDSITQAELLATRINASVKTGIVVRGIIQYGQNRNTYGRISSWPGIDGKTETYAVTGTPS
jgi:hypothetical protein